MIPGLRPVKRQYFWAYTVMGSVLPYLPVFLEGRGLSMSQIGWVLSLTGVGIIVSPVLTTLLADTRVQSRTLLGVLFALTGGSLAWLAGVGGFWGLMVAFGCYSVAFAPVTSLQDGMYFHRRQELESAGGSPPAYHSVRVWGTFGFILPSLGLYLLLARGYDTSIAVWCAAGCAAVGLANSLTLPRQRRGGAAGRKTTEAAAGGTGGAGAAGSENLEDTAEPAGPAEQPKGGGKLPTVAAWRALTAPRVRVFCIATFLLQLAAAAYYGFYPVYLTGPVGIDERWIGLISNLGVLVEVGFMLGCGWILRGIGMRWLLVLGAGAMALRFVLLGVWPNVGVAVGTQALHGVMVLVIHVAPPMYIDRRARPAFRNSIQGLYAMAVYGIGRILGNLLAGWVGDESSLPTMFLYAAGLCVVAACLLGLAFGDLEGDRAADGRATR